MREELMGLAPILSVASVLDLRVEGAVGTFSVKPAAPDSPSIPVKYIQTHITFDLDGGHKERLFQNLLPVREVFQTKDLGFEDLMQRDIDDGRVSTELIKYLLEPGAAVKFFPPIVAVVVPVGPQNKLLPSYPDIVEERIQNDGYVTCIERSGLKGKESFEFEQIEVNGELQEFDYARLRINTNRCKIVIVDGQHRAMALLALYRNLKGWPDNTAAFRHYYSRWSPEYLNHFDLSKISLPIAICVFPTLTGEHPALRVTEACRAVFLALNKNAKPVTRARNILLNDRDLVPFFERAILEEVKSYDPETPNRLRLWNFELDAEKDRSVLTSAVALSGVMHLHLLLERALMLNQKPGGFYVHGTSNYWLRKNIDDTILRRLDGANILGAELAANTTRNSFTTEALKLLQASFAKRYLRYIIKGFQEFSPYTAQAAAASDIEIALRPQTDKRPHAMLFEGQGVLRVFRQYVEDLSKEASEQRELRRLQQASELDAILGELKVLQETVTKQEGEFRAKRAQKYLSSVAPSKVNVLIPYVDKLYREEYTTAAFQIALFVTFFFMMEDYHGQDGDLRLTGDDVEMELFDEYLACINSFFAPKMDADVKRLLSVFVGSVSGTFGSSNMTVAASSTNLRSIIVPGELKPDEWPRFRYMLLELWRPADERLAALIRGYRSESRSDVLKAFYRQKIKVYCKEKGIDEKQVSEAVDSRLKREARTQFENALAELVGKLPEAERIQLNAALDKSVPPSEEEVTPQTVEDDSTEE
jgi:hypothetical protein